MSRAGEVRVRRRVCGRAGRRKTCAHTRNISLLRIVFPTVRESDLPCTSERLPLGGQEFFPGGAAILPRPDSTPLPYHSPFPLAHGFLPLFSPTVRRDRFYRIVSPKPDSTREKVTFSLATPSPRRITLTRFQDGSMYRERISYARRNLRVGKLRLRQGRDFDAEASERKQNKNDRECRFHVSHYPYQTSSVDESSIVQLFLCLRLRQTLI